MPSNWKFIAAVPMKKGNVGRDPFNQNSNRSDREKWSTSKSGPVFSKLFRLDRTDPLSFGPTFPEILVEWIAPVQYLFTMGSFLTGLNLCMGCPVDNDLMKFISVEVTNLENEVANIKQYSSDEANKITAALQTTRDEVDKVHERITDIEKQMETDRKERLEKQEALSSDIEDISNSLAKLDKRVDVNKEDISQLKEKQSDLNTTVSTITDDQARLTEDMGALKMEHSQLDTRVKALENDSFKTTNAKIFQVPSRNRCFCGRDRELEAIAAQLKYSQTGCIHSAICGLGGVGKTSLAVEFLWQQKGEYPGGIFWISGENNDLFQRSVCEMARQIGTFENDFDNSLSSTLEWLGKREKLWCLVVDNLDELEMSKEMRKLLTGHWKHVARGHIIITTRREVSEVGEDTGIDEQCCIDLKCLTEEEGIYFLRKRTGKDEGEDNDLRELVRELGGLPLALDQAGAYIRWVKQSVKEYVKKYRKQKLLLLKKKKAQLFVENTSPERLAVHTTWTLNFHHISHISKEMELGEFPIRFMQVCAFYGPDDIPYELVNEGLKEDCSSAEESGLWDQAEIVSLLTNFSLFQRFESESFSVHRLVQEVIRSQMEKEQTELVLSRAVCVLHHALKNTRSPAEVCESFVEDTVFGEENPPSLHLWGKLALHSTYLQEHLRDYCAKHEESVHTLLYTEETVRVFNEASIFFSVSQEKVKAQEIQKLKLDFLVNITKATTEDGTKPFKYFIDIPLKDKEYKLISHCMRQSSPEDNSPDVAETSRTEMEEKANQIREEGNFAVKRNEFEEASELYSTAIKLKVDDWRLFANRALCYLKLGRPQQALEDCEKCLSLDRNNSKALQRKIWALHNLVNEGATHLNGQKRATMAVAVYFHPSLRTEVTFCEMFPEVRALSPIEITNETHLAFALMMRKGNETFLLREGKYNLKNFTVLTNLQMVGLEQQVVLNCVESCCILHQSKCYFENITFPKGSSGIMCQGKDAAIHMNQCESSGGFVSCEDSPECNGGPGCIAASLGRPVCDRTDKFGDPGSESGVAGSPGIQITSGSSAFIENCVIRDCGGGGALVAWEGAYMEVRKCEIHRNHQAGLEARLGGQLVAFKNRVFNNGYHGILIGPNAGECDVNENKVFENAKEGIFVGRTEHKIVVRNNDVHHNRLFGISLQEDPCLLVSKNRIFENGFWGIQAQLRTSAKITGNVISGNKCGGIFINVNYSGRVYLDSNIVRDHSGPWLFGEYAKYAKRVEFPVENSLPSKTPPPPGEKNIYSIPPILYGNKEFNNKEGIYHPRKVVERLHDVCTFCGGSRHEGKRLIKCSNCKIASYCSKECRSRHFHAHEALCKALKSRYSITFDETSLRNQYALRYAIHVKGSGTGPELKLNSREKFIIKIQTQTQNGHPKQLLHVYDQSRTLECDIQSPEIFNIIMECGVLGSLNKHTSKKVFFLASFDEGGKKLTIYLDQLAPYQQW